MGKNGLYILGAGSYGSVICELAEINNYRVLGFYDDNESLQSNSIFNIPILGKIDLNTIECEGVSFAIAIGKNSTRKKFCEEIAQRGGLLPSLIHPTADISKSSKIGKGCLIHAHAYVWTQSEIHDYTILSPNVVVAHHTIIEKACFISTGSNIGAGIHLGEATFIGIGSTIMTGVKTLGKNALIGAGSVVINDVPANATVVGNPAKIIKYVES